VESIKLRSLQTGYDVAGSGPTIIWVSGGGGAAADWADYLTAFSDCYRSIAFDNRGTSGTSCTQPLPWTIADMARDTAELIEELSNEPVVVVGHSMGAMIMLQLATDRPDLVRLGISLAGAARGDQGWVGDYMRAEIELRKRGQHLDPAFSAVHYAAMMYPAKALQDQQMWNAIRQSLGSEAVAQNTEDTVIAQWQPCVEFNLADRLPSVTVPLEAVCFSEDVCSPPAYSAQIAALAPNARLHELEGMGHGSLFGHRPDEVAAFIRTLIDEHFAGTRHQPSVDQQPSSRLAF
jgi:pimeloyl-ACP methyl ester carboxylesterase